MKRSQSQHFSLSAAPARSAGSGLFVAYSGGLDSSVLLHLLAEQGTPGLHAVHVHHGLQPAADDWVLHCEKFCAALCVPLTILRVDVVAAADQGPEAAAREARYAALRSLLREGDVLATAHHQDDQAETVLLRLLRGSGTQGLSAMRRCEAFPPGQLWRPLLATPRSALICYAQTQRLSWIDDPHNSDPRYARSWLRARVTPLLAQRWPGYAASLARSAALAAEAAGLLDEVAASDHEQVAIESSLSISRLKILSGARRMNLLRWWLHCCSGLPPAPHQILVRIAPEIFEAREDAAPLLAWPGGELRRYRDLLFAMPPLESPPAAGLRLDWDGCGRLRLPAGCGFLEGLSDQVRQPLTIGFAGGGERFQPVGSSRSRTLKNLFQEQAVPPWQRLRTPLLWQGEQLIWVAGIGWSRAAVDGGQAFELLWRA